MNQIKSSTARLVVRNSNKGVQAQVILFEPKGDRTVACANSKELEEFGWLAQSNTPTAYLVGLMAGMRAKKKGISEFHLDIGLSSPTKGRILFAAAYGAKDAGLSANIGDGLVDSKRIKGEHISEYAKMLKSQDPAKFARLFGRYVAKSIDVMALPALFEKTKERIASGWE
jgi:large subunit ribosomal protein L18